MLGPSEEAATVSADGFVNAVAVKETVIEDGNARAGGGQDAAVQKNVQRYFSLTVK